MRWKKAAFSRQRAERRPHFLADALKGAAFLADALKEGRIFSPLGLSRR
jgi:hypothetical protein